MGLGPVYQITDLILYYRYISTILEVAMYSILYQHLNINSILTTEQFGFRKNRSTEHKAYALINGIFQAWNSKLQVVGILVTPLRLSTV